MTETSSPRQNGALLAYLRVGLYVVLALAIGAAAFAGYQAVQAKANVSRTQDSIVSGMGLATPTQKHLAPQFTDSQGRLLADPPSDPAKLIDPETLVVAYHEDSDAENQPIDWDQYCSALAKATGKKVVSQVFTNSVADVAALNEGHIHVLALHAADTPYLVNNAGLIPIAVLGNEEGANGNRLDLVVPPSSPIKTTADLKGHTLTCTVPTSITGYRAAVALLMLDAKLRPNVDYLVNFSLGQKKSIKGVVSGQYEAAAMSDDKIQSLLAKNTLQKNEYNVIYQSEVIPRLTLGYLYRLKPDLAAKIKQASLDFNNDASPADEDGGKAMRFVPVDYKKDFELVRRIDDAFDPRFGVAPKIKEDASPATAPSASQTAG